MSMSLYKQFGTRGRFSKKKPPCGGLVNFLVEIILKE